MVARRVSAAGLIVLGLVWLGQGIGWIGGSFMTGQSVWAVIGVVCIAAGIALLVRPAGRGRA